MNTIGSAVIVLLVLTAGFVVCNQDNDTTTVHPIIKSSPIASDIYGTTTPLVPDAKNVTTDIPTTTSLSSTVLPDTTSSTTTITAAPDTSPSTEQPSTTTSSSTVSPGPNVTTIAPEPQPPKPRPSHWSTTSFVGGMVFAFGMVAIGFVSIKFYKSRNERNYHTL